MTRAKNRRGVSLIEVMVALVLFGVIATVHTAATMRYGVRQRVAALGASRAAAITQAIDFFSSVPRDEIAGHVGCEDVEDFDNFPYERCVSTTAVSGTVGRITIIITPENTDLKPDTLTVDRVTINTTPVFN